MKIYDISQEVFSCAVYPGDPSPEREVMLSIADGAVCNLTAFRMCAHNGTHVDAPFHFLNDGKKVDQVELNRFVGPAYVAEAEGEITADIARRILQEARACDAEAAERILVKGKAVVTPDAAAVFADAKIKLFGNESQTVGPEDAPMQVHLTMLGAEIVLLEGIRLAAVPVGKYLLNAAPINLGGADGAPCRAILIDLDHPYPHCGFEGPTIGERLPEGTILVSEGDGCVREVRPNDPEWRMLAIERGMLKAEIPDGSLRTALYGAILGDMIGAPYEFDQGDKSKDFALFNPEVHYTDDSAMTLAIAKAITEVGPDADEATMKRAFVACMQDFGGRYAQYDYGGRFIGWLHAVDPKPYGSFGNGSAMRVSAVGWCYDSLERTRKVARWSAEVSHNHPEGIKGAESVASAIFLLRNGSTKEEVKDYICREFGYDLSRTCDEIRPYYHHVESCQQTVPEAITAFLESTDFEDAIRTAVSLGGDCDTLTCITGSLAEAFYGVPEWMVAECEKRLPDELLQVLKKFRTVID